jgi:hypothetical protein
MNYRFCRITLLIAFLCFQTAGSATPDLNHLDSPMDTETADAKVSKSTVELNNKRLASTRELRRLDFRIENKSCPVCLLGIQNKLKTFNGVMDAAVMVRRPYGASVIYRGDKTTSSYILELLKAKDPSIKIADITDNKIDSIPLVLIPPFMPAVETPAPIPTRSAINGGL